MIIDCFTFYNELELLEIRLHELRQAVDWFVLVEAGETFSGKSKPFVFEAHRQEFNDFNIAYVQIDKFPLHLTTSWDREYYSRDAIAAGLGMLNASPDDIVMLSDVDEIPRGDTLAQVTQALSLNQIGAIGVFSHQLYYYYVNCKSEDRIQGTRMTRVRDFRTAQELRLSGGTLISQGGWHFSYLGGAHRIKEKIGAYAHTELDTPEFTATNNIERCLDEAKDLFGRDMALRFEPLDGNLPRHLLEHQERFQHLIKQPTTGPTAAPPPAHSGRKPLPADALFLNAIETPSDINQHLPFLFRLASTVDHVTEFGTRSGVSTIALIMAQPKRLVSYDLERSLEVADLEAAAQQFAVDFSFKHEDVLTAQIEDTDLLFIDTLHNEGQMRAELQQHANQARKYLVLHDTETFGFRGESEGHRGIWYAVADFMRENPHWSLMNHFPHNNGLSVFVRG